MTALGNLGKPCIISSLIVSGENSEAGRRDKGIPFILPTVPVLSFLLGVHTSAYILCVDSLTEHP